MLKVKTISKEERVLPKLVIKINRETGMQIINGRELPLQSNRKTPVNNKQQEKPDIKVLNNVSLDTI